MTPDDAILDAPTIITLYLDAQEITEWESMLHTARGVLDALGAAPDDETAFVAQIIESAYGRPALSDAEWAALEQQVRDLAERKTEGSDLEFR
jgi:hypothetical protein